MKKPLVSVVIPSYNRRDTLGRAIESVKLQRLDNIEIVVVDDGSEDDTVNYVKSLHSSDPRIRLIEHDVNRGEAAARNTGVKSALGDYIAFLDSDDEWLSGKLEAQIKVMQQADDSVAACCTGQYVLDEKNQETLCKDWTEKYPISDITLLIRGCGVSMGNTFFIRRSVYEEIGFYDENLPLFVDLDWLCRLTRKYTVVKINHPYARYHKAPMRDGEPMELAVKIFEKKNQKYLKSFSRLQRLRIKSSFLNYISLAYLANGPWKSYIKTRIQQVLHDPIQHPWTYIHLIGTMIGMIPVGRGINKQTRHL